MKMLMPIIFGVILLGISSVVGKAFIDKKGHDAFAEQITIFQSQTAEWDSEKIYKPGDILQAMWTFKPIIWDTPITMEATFIFVNTDTGQQFLTGEFRSLPFFNQLQYQVSTALGYLPDSYRLLTTSYHLPAQLVDGNYKITICQRFEHDGYTTAYTCYDGPSFQVQAAPE